MKFDGDKITRAAKLACLTYNLSVPTEQLGKHPPIEQGRMVLALLTALVDLGVLDPEDE